MPVQADKLPPTPSAGPQGTPGAPLALTLRVAPGDVAALRELLAHRSTGAPRTQRVLAVLADSPPQAGQGPAPAAALFRLRLRRTRWGLPFDGLQAEARLDEGLLRKDDTRWPLSELTLVLAAGERAALFDLALQLQAVLPLRLGDGRLTEGSWGLHRPAGAAQLPASEPPTDPEFALEAGYRLVLGPCLAHIHRHAAGVAQDARAEAVHQLRIGLRRLMSAWRLFAQRIPPPRALQEEVAWLFDELGPARDAQVLRDTTLPALAAAATGGNAPVAESDWTALQAAVASSAEAAERRAAQAVDSVRCTRLLLGLGAWLAGSRWRNAMGEAALRPLAAPWRPHAAAWLARLHRTLLHRGRGLPTAGPVACHRARVAAKRLRYAAESLAPAAGLPQPTRYIGALVALQAALGQRQDAVVAAR
ncbi:MAG: hypothetical protein RL227_1145, partial [Pseudomonadota bacterium]